MDLKERANTLFKKRAFKEAAALYAKAEAQSPDDPTFPSNLSAAFFESGDYAGCFHAILRAFVALAEKSDGKEALALRLSTRMAKALANGVASGCLALASVDERREALDGIRERAGEKGSLDALGECRRAWEDWDRVRDEWEKLGEKEKTQAHVDVSQLSVLKKPIDPVLEYYMMGHDPILSIVDDYGPDEPWPMPLDQVPLDLLPNLSFLFGGVGDARHVYGSIIGLYRAHNRAPSARRAQIKAHITLLDIHPTMVARDLVVFMLMDLLVQGNESPASEIEIKGAIFHTFMGVLVPNAYNRWVGTVVKRLRSMLSQTPPRLPEWLYASEEAARKLHEVFRQWDPFPEEKNAQEIVTHYRYHPAPIEFFTDVPLRGFFDYHQEKRHAEVLSILTDYSTHLRDKQTPESNRKPPLTRAQAVEDLWHQVTTTYVPSKELRKSLPKASILLDYMTSTDRRVHNANTLEAMYQEAMSEINANYSANTTFYDPLSRDNRVMSFRGWSNLSSIDVLELFPILQEFNARFKLPPNAICKDEHESVAFGAASTFFDAVVASWKALRGKLTFEVVLGELNREMARMRSPASGRPAAFPQEFTRMWLSNVPDYTHGLMNQAVFVMPSLQTHRYAGVASNCLLHMMSFPNTDDYCHSYTLLNPRDMPRYLNCHIDRLHPMSLELVAWHSPERRLAELPDRTDVVRWLTRVLLNILWPGDLSIRQRCFIGDGVRHPNNLNAYIALLLHLPTLGYPAHWLAEFVRTLLSNALLADVPLFVGPLPIPTAYSTERVPSRAMWLDPWLPELRTILALAYAATPVALPLVPDARAEIGVYEACPLVSPTVRFDLYQRANAHAPSTSLMFFSPHACRRSHEEMIRDVRGVLEGTGYRPPAGKMAIWTAAELVDVDANVVRWRMFAKDFERMREEKWAMVVYRYDTDSVVGRPMVASTWRRVGDIRVPS
ncbi:hypothetical protein OF83DRAFT_1129611 [Amylostereum chailletii]|nr:hypothetical protein OF83DRAFT_1129611 [Amylostereum chailletii]